MANSVERRIVRLDNNNIVALSQIASWLSFPNRPEYAVKVIREWLYWNYHDAGYDVTDWTDIKYKRSVLEKRAMNVDWQFRLALEAGYWLQKRKNLEAHKRGVKWNLGKSMNQLAREKLGGDANKDELGNVRTNNWRKRLSVHHLSSALINRYIDHLHSINIIKHHPRGTNYDYWGLGLMFFGEDWMGEISLDWVDDVIIDSENTAEWSDKLGIIPIKEAFKFTRD